MGPEFISTDNRFKNQLFVSGNAKKQVLPSNQINFPKFHFSLQIISHFYFWHISMRWRFSFETFFSQLYYHFSARFRSSFKVQILAAREAWEANISRPGKRGGGGGTTSIVCIDHNTILGWVRDFLKYLKKCIIFYIT